MEKYVKSCGSSKEAANEINNFFADVCTSRFDESEQEWCPKPETNITDIPDHLLPSELETYQILQSTKLSKSGGSFQSWVWKENAIILCKPVHSIWCNSLKCKVFPDQWKLDTVTPLPKTKIVNSATELRPITITEIPAKGLEKVVSKRIKHLIDATITADQHAYKRKDSSEVALISLMDTIATYINTEPSTVRILLVDTQKAFDSVEHKILLDAIERTCDSSIHCFLPWINSFLSNRKQRIKLLRSGKPVFSEWKTKTRGLPQGTVTGPMYYNVITNDLQPKSKNSTFVKFADDLSAANSVSKTSPTDGLQFELDNVLQWSENKNLQINMTKTKELLIQRRRSADPAPLEGIRRVQKAKILGVYVDSALTFKAHVEHLQKKCSSNIFLLKRLKQLGYSQEELRYFVETVLLPSLTYGYGSWCAASDNTLKPLERLYKKAMKIAGYNGEPLQKILKKKLVRTFDNALADSDHPLHSIVTTHTKESHSERNKRLIHTIKPRTELYKNCFVYKSTQFHNC